MADTDRSTDRGFTLTEVIVVVLMVAVLASVIVAVVAVILRNVPTTEARADDSRSYQRLIQWLPRDAASTPPNQFETVGPWAPSCAGATGGYLVHMSWDVGTDTAVAEYRLVPDGSGVMVQRFSCSSGAGYSDTATVDVTSRIHDAVATPREDVPGHVVGVTLTLTTCLASDCSVGDATIELAAGSRNPLEALSTTTTSSTTTTTSTSTTTTTTTVP